MLKKFSISFATLLLAFCTHPAHADAPGREVVTANNETIQIGKFNGTDYRVYLAYPVTENPVIDGNLDDDFWKQIPKAKYFHVDSRQTDSVTKQSMIQLAYDDEFLYIAATMFESSPDLIKEGARVQDGWPNTDRINFIFSREYNKNGAYNDSPYVFVQFGAGGIHRAFRNLLPDKRDIPVESPSTWKTGYSKTATRWMIESKVPLRVFAANPSEDGHIFFNVRRDSYTGPAPEVQSMWSRRTVANQGAHCFGTLLFLKQPGSTSTDHWWMNAGPRYWYFRNVLEPLGNKQGDYVGAIQKFSSHPDWHKADVIAQKIGEMIQSKRGANLDELDDCLMEWQAALRNMERASPPRDFKIETRNVTIASFKLNGNLIAGKNGKYPIPLTSGINTFEIVAEATGNNPGVKFNLADSPETSNHFAVTNMELQNPVLAENTDGYLWLGEENQLLFTQNLIWNSEYCNHPLEFIGPQVKEWGVSPNEMMFFMHALYNPLKKGACKYQLIVEVPEGFTRVSDAGCISIYSHYWTQDVKSENVLLDGSPHTRYTYTWNLPEKFFRDMPAYGHFISFINESKRKPGEQTAFRFRRIVDGNTTDIVNVIPVVILPPLHGGKLSKILFPMYHNFMGGNVSREQWAGMVEGSMKAGLNSFILQGGFFQNEGDPRNVRNIERKYRNELMNRPGTVNFLWAVGNLPQWGAGSNRGALHSLVTTNKDLQATFCTPASKGNDNGFWNEFCLTGATGKYREEFKAALVTDYKRMMADCGVNYIFINDENYPKAHNGWEDSSCFCDPCKADFCKMFNVPEEEVKDNMKMVIKFETQWSKWWKHYQKNLLLQMAYDAIHEAGGKLWYYHNTHDTDAYAEAKGKYDLLSIPIPGNAFVGSNTQATMDAAKESGEKISGSRHSFGQFHSYYGLGKISFLSSDGYYFYPREIKTSLIREAATTFQGAISECASFFSAGALYYAGEATRLIAAYESLFYDGVRQDDLATSAEFSYPNKLVLVKGDERLVLLFNESKDKTVTGTVQNLNLKASQTAEIWGQEKHLQAAGSVAVTVPPQDVTAIYIGPER